VTSNLTTSEWGNVFGDPVVATAILDCLLHQSHAVTIRGDSYRLREKRKSGLLKPIMTETIATQVPAAEVVTPSELDSR
jgi:hypothetical protein